MSSSDSPPKESILKIMDDFLSHLNQTKKLFMMMIFASFIIAPLSLASAVFVLTPPFAMYAGQPYDVAVSFVGVPVPEPGFGFSVGVLNQSDIIVGNFTMPAGSMHAPSGIMQYDPGAVIVLRDEGIHQIGNETALVLKSSAVNLHYVPSGAMPAESFVMPGPPPPPRFMYVGDGGQFGRQTDVTTLVVVIVVISAALAATWLVLGVKEYKFFSRWNQRYSNYKKLQDELDRDLQN